MKPIDCIEHVVMSGERWDTLSWRYYGNPYSYGRIIEANPSIDIATVLESGSVVLIPVISFDEVQKVQQLLSENLPPWKQ